MRFFIHYDYQFNLRVNDFFLKPNKEDVLFQNVKFIIPLIYLFPHSKTELNDILLCLTGFINQLKRYLCTPNNFFHDPILRSIADEIFASCHILLAPIESITLKYALPVYLSFLYFNSYCTIFGVEDITYYEIEFLINILSLIPRIDISIFCKSPDKFLSPLVDGSLRVLNVLRNYNVSEYLTRQSYCLGTSIIDKFTHLFKMNIDNNFAFMKRYSEGMDDIAHFILWCIDHYPINFLSINGHDDYLPFNPKYHDPKYHLIPSEVCSDMHFPNLPSYAFIETPTFSEPVKTVSQLREENSYLHDFGSKISEFKFPDPIRNRKQLAYLASRIIVFMHALSEQNIVYLKKFVESILDIISDLFGNEPNKLGRLNKSSELDSKNKPLKNSIFDINGHNLPLSFYYFVVAIFNKCNSNMICAVFSLMQNGFSVLLEPKIFSPFINRWAAANMTAENAEIKDEGNSKEIQNESEGVDNNNEIQIEEEEEDVSQSQSLNESKIESKDDDEEGEESKGQPRSNNKIKLLIQSTDNEDSQSQIDDEESQSQSQKEENREDEESQNKSDEEIQSKEDEDSQSQKEENREDEESQNKSEQEIQSKEDEDSQSQKEENKEDDESQNKVEKEEEDNHFEDDKDSQSKATEESGTAHDESQDASGIDDSTPIEPDKNYFDFVFHIRHAVIHFLSTCFHVASSHQKSNSDQLTSTPKKVKKKPSISRSQSQQVFQSSFHGNSPTSSKEADASNVRIDENSSFSECFEFEISAKDFEYDFDLPFDKERCAFYMMSSIYSLFVDSAPQIFDEVVPLLFDFIHCDAGFLIKTSNKAGIFEMLMNHLFDLQLLHIGLKKEKNKKYQKYLPNVELSRLSVFRIFDVFLRTNEGKLFIFGSQQFVQYLFHLLFEPSVMYFASDLIKRCVMLNADSITQNNTNNQFKIIFRNISELIKTSIGHIGDFRWIKLLLVLFESLKDAFAINRNSIFEYLRSQQVLLLLSRLPIEVVRSNQSHFSLYTKSENDDDCLNFQVTEEDQPYMKIFEDVFDIFIHLSRENAYYAETLASSYDSYYDNITAGLKLIKFGTSIVDRLLSLVFEQPLSIKKLPTTTQIRNYFALPFLFNSTTHLSFHPLLMKFLSDVCTDSVSNKLRVFQAHLPEVIIDYLQNFPSQNEQSRIVTDSIAVSLRLFSIVSQYVFSVPTLFRCIQAMRTRDGNRVWWTGQLLSLFSTYIENSAKSSPCAFFYLDGRHTGFFLKEEIPQITFSKGWSFMCRFELDSFGWSNIGGVLLYMQFKNGDSFSISVTNVTKNQQENDKKMNSKGIKISYIPASYKSHSNSIGNNDTNSKYWSEVIDTFEIQSNKWYDLLFSSDFNLYITSSNVNNNINSNQIFSHSLKNVKKIDLRQGVQTASIGNTPPLVASEAPLVANISTFYFFTKTMNIKTVKLLLSLPLSFVFGFSPSERKLDPRLPELLFNDSFDSQLFLGINARKTDGSTCFNIAKRIDIQSCTFRGVAFPFSTSFIDIINYSGGLKLFLPLFEQVNLPMYKEENVNDNASFFLQLISMFQSFFQHSKLLEADFVRYDGFKAMSYSLMKIHPQHYMKNILYSLFIMCTILEPEFRSIMIDEIWLNFNIWKRLTVDIQSYLYDTIFNEFRNSENFRDHIQIGELCAVIAEQPAKELRTYLWRLLASMAQISFTSDEQDSLFSFLFLKENIPFQLEALQCFYELCKLNINDICLVFQRKRMFQPFLQLLASDQEKVRLISLKIIFIIYHFYKSSSNATINSSSILNSNLILPEQFDIVILTAVHQLIMGTDLTIHMIDIDEKEQEDPRFTQETWKTIMSIAFNNETSSDLRFIVPIACSCSHFYDNHSLSQFQSTLELLLESSSQTQQISTIAKSVTDCSRWYFWLLYFSIQKAQDVYKFSERDNDAIVLGRIFEYMVQIDKIDEVVFFFDWICYTRGWNTMPFLNSIFNTCLSFIKKCHFTKFINIVFEIFIFLFYIKNNEKFATNVQLYAEHSQTIKNELLDEIKSSISLIDYININDENNQSEPSEKDTNYSPPSSDYFSFSMRITEDGKWIDLNLAKKLIAFISLYSEKSGVTTMSFSKIPKTKLAEIFSFLIYCVVRVDPSVATIKNILIYIKQFFTPKSIDTLSFKMITTAFAKVSLSTKTTTTKNQEEEKEESIQSILNDFYRQNGNIINNLNADFNDVSFCRNIIQDYSADIASWLEIIQGFTINICELYKQRYSTYVPLIHDTIRIIKKPFQNRSYTKEMDDNIIALKRKQRRNRSLTAKIFRRIQRAMTVNGGPWCSNKTQNHWKLAPRTDVHMRHLFVRPNWHFDIHKGASLRRDKAKNEQAKLEYQRWIENQDNATSTEFSIEDAEDIQQMQQQQQQQQQQQMTKSQYQFSATMITIQAVYDGNFLLSRSEICFDGAQVKDEYLFSIEKNSSKTVEFNLSEVVWVLHRSYLHIDRGLEFFCNDGRSYFFYFSLQDRNQILKILSDYRPPNLLVLQRTSSQRCFNEQRFTEKWLNKEMSTYDYLMTVNLFAGRSYNDLSQYPIFPWILADYTSETIDVDANPPPPGLFRDLSKPIGALNEKRLAKLQKELEILKESNEDMNMSSFSCLNESPCLYRCHYSTAYYVLLYMIRLEPFTTMHILMQDDKFDHPDRLFQGIEKAWKTVSSTSNDFRELIPEFFTLPEFLTNSDHFDLGLNENEGSNVILPKWAKDPYWFIQIHRRALESEYVAQNIGYWIDLIFGCKQNGQAAVDANNTFHAYCYPSVINSPEVKADKELLYEVQKHAGSFGIIPRQLFTSPHPNFPSQNSSASQNDEGQKSDEHQIRNQQKNISNEDSFLLSQAYKVDSDIVSMVVSTHLYFVTTEARLFRMKPKQFICESSAQIPFGVGKFTAIFPKLKLFVVTSPSGDSFHTFSLDSYNTLTHVFSFRQQFSSLTAIVSAGESYLVVLSQDGSLTVWDFNNVNTTKVPKQTNVVIPSSNSVTNINSSTTLGNLSNATTLNVPKRTNKIANNSDSNDSLFAAKEEFSYLPVDIESNTIPKSNSAVLTTLAINTNNINTLNNINFINTSVSPSRTTSNTSYDNTSSYDPAYKVNHHLVSAVCVTASYPLRLIVSCDISRRIVLTELVDGSFIRSFSIPDESAMPVGLLILDAAYIVTFCEHRSHNDIRSTIQIYALDSSMLSIFDHPRPVTASCAINLVNGNSYIAVGFSDGTLVILSSPDASVVHTKLFPSPIVAISQKDGEKLLYLANAEKQIFSLDLDL